LETKENNKNKKITRKYIQPIASGGKKMTMPKDEIQSQLNDAWMQHFASLEKSVSLLEKHIEEAKGMAGICTDEWCEATEHVIDDLNNALFSISEPRNADPELSLKIKELRRRIYDLYANYKGIYEKAS
jgi:hypothetical protein